MITRPTIHIESSLAPLEAAIHALQGLAERDPDSVRAFFEELVASGDVERQLFSVDSEQRSAAGADEIRIVFEPSERLRKFLAKSGAGDVL